MEGRQKLLKILIPVLCVIAGVFTFIWYRHQLERKQFFELVNWVEFENNGKINFQHKWATVDLSNTDVTDLKPLLNYEKVWVLGLSNTAIKDFSPLSKMVHLKELHLSNCRITDLDPLMNLENLKKLDLRGVRVPENQIKKLQNKRTGLLIIR